MKKILFIIFIFLFFQSISFAKSDMEYIHEDEGVHIYKIDINSLGSKIKPFVSESLVTADDVFSSGKYRLVVNAGFFDLKSGDEVSFVIIDGKTVNSPFNNNKLLSDLNSQGRLKEVVNRPELRIFALPNGKYSFRIANHFDSDVDKLYMVHSVQAGHTLAPYYQPEKEGFIKYDDEKLVTFDSVSLQKRRARTVIGIKKNYLYIIVFSDVNKKSGLEIAKFVKKQKYKQAMAFDGGWSTSLVTDDVKIQSGNASMRKVKSFLVIEK